uniref:Uncharacterized protein n=1 Tax=Cacopsylla melanoneura TaxID=428564 RepID=A0A8D8VWR6_9HEMI
MKGGGGENSGFEPDPKSVWLSGHCLVQSRVNALNARLMPLGRTFSMLSPIYRLPTCKKKSNNESIEFLLTKNYFLKKVRKQITKQVSHNIKFAISLRRKQFSPNLRN